MRDCGRVVLCPGNVKANTHALHGCRVDLPGGPLQIEWRESDNHVYMTGPAMRVFAGTAQVPS